MKRLLTILIVLAIHTAFSQNNTGARITVFKPTDDKVKAISKKDSLAGHDHNCIKWNFSLLARGVFLFNYEFRVTGGLTAELGLGLTYEDFIFEATYATTNWALDGGMDWTAMGKPAPHPCGEAGIRYYLSGFDNFEGIYVAGTLSYRPYSFPNSPIMPSPSSQVPGYSFFDSQFKIGYQAEGFYSDFVYDVYLGVGYRSANIDYYSMGTNSITGQPTVTPANVSTSYPQILFGMKIGYSF